MSIEVFIDANLNQAAYITTNGLVKLTKLSETDINKAEFSALLIVLKAMWDFTRELTIYTDSTVLCKQINGEKHHKQLEQQCNEAIERIKTYTICNIKWVSRNKNLAGMLLDNKQVVLNNHPLAETIRTKHIRHYK